MASNISFGSMFNLERVSRNYLENLSNPEHNIEGLKNDAERPKDFPALPSNSIGRSQVIKTDSELPHKLELSAEDKKLLSGLCSSMYGFHDNSNEFWVYKRKPMQGKIPNLVMGDGRLQDNMSRNDFAKELVHDGTQAFQIAGNDKYGGNKLITVVKNSKSNTMTMYTCDSKQCYPMTLDGDVDIKKLATSIADNLIRIQGVTVWTE